MTPLRAKKELLRKQRGACVISSEPGRGDLPMGERNDGPLGADLSSFSEKEERPKGQRGEK